MVNSASAAAIEPNRLAEFHQVSEVISEVKGMLMEDRGEPDALVGCRKIRRISLQQLGRFPAPGRA